MDELSPRQLFLVSQIHAQLILRSEAHTMPLKTQINLPTTRQQIINYPIPKAKETVFRVSSPPLQFCPLHIWNGWS